MSERMNSDTPEMDAATAQLEEEFIRFIRAAISEDEAPIVLEGYVFQLQATKFDPLEDDGRLPLVWGRKPDQSVVISLGLEAVLARNIDNEVEEMNEDG